MVELPINPVEFSINPSEKSVMYTPMNAIFKYDADDRLTLVDPGCAAQCDIPLITKGVQEALRQQRERDPRIAGRF